MNAKERLMVDLLTRGREAFGVASVKAEFEAEGTRPDELLRLVDIARAADLPITVKIGGCEAIRDLLEAKQIGVNFIVAPMVESTYALSKFASARDLVFDLEDQQDVDFLFNVETELAFESVVPLADVAAGSRLSGVVFGRVDFVGSLGRSRDDINHPDVLNSVVETARACRERGLDLVVGGGVSIDALPFLNQVASTHLSRFETRKVVFSASALDLPDIEAGLLNAVHFELLWLQNKRDYYARITQEDARRIEMLEDRWKVLGGGVR